MPLKVSSLAAGEHRTVSLDWEGDTVRITYRDIQSPLFFQLQARRVQILRALEKGKGVGLDDAADVSEALATVLSTQIVSWDVLAEDGSEYPATFPALSVLPLAFLFAAFDAIAVGESDPNAKKTARRSRNT